MNKFAKPQSSNNRPPQPNYKNALFENFFSPKPSPQQTVQKPTIIKEAPRQHTAQPSQNSPSVGAGVIEKISETQADSFAIERPEVKRVTYGMRNLGNTCFFNSVMQCLSHSRALVNFCLSGVHSQTCRKKESCYLCLYTQYLKGIQREQRTNPQMVVYKLKSIWSRYSVGRQEDAHEFLIIFVESLVNSCFQMAKPPREFLYKNQNKTSVFQIIGGKSRSQVHCLGCGHRSNTYEDLIALSLELPKQRQMGSATLEQCLSGFCTVETLKGDNKYMCGGCKKKCEAKKRFSIESTPRTLIIHIKRFTNFGNKIGEFIKYPSTLSLKPYMSDTHTGDSETFDLYGVVVHQGGGCRSGHYFSYCKGFDGEWYDCNDDFVGRTQMDRVLRQQAYILFYQKRITAAPKVQKVEKEAKIEKTSETVKVDEKKRDVKAEDKKEAQETQMKKEDAKSVEEKLKQTKLTKMFKEDREILFPKSHSEQTTSMSSNNLSEESIQKDTTTTNTNTTPEIIIEKKEQPSAPSIQDYAKAFIKSSSVEGPETEKKEQLELTADPSLRRAKSNSEQDVTAPTPTIFKAEVPAEPKILQKPEPKTYKQPPLAFTPLRSQLHPKIGNLSGEKRRLEATISLISMANKGINQQPATNARSSQLFKRFKSDLNPEYRAQNIKIGQTPNQ
ncbi:hypothetical protein FGO68_gene2032 [Halteria grandinella]|uniref:Ubiquitin carboxyl-terminal hydrolase n=1 Tax=Halteria grandinella TaxID=5974 RepID=A0A8J8T566_HALGN|nr:hypothetical protein FGO68_gene2032 [Halteria grandinella]